MSKNSDAATYLRMLFVVLSWCVCMWMGSHRHVSVPPTGRPSVPTFPESAAPGTFKVIGISDGDTADILKDGKTLRLRFSGIDTPETGQPFGNTAKQALANRIAGQYVRVVIHETDRYGRSVADVYDDDGHVNLWLVQEGLAWHHTAYSNDPALSAAELQAKAQEIGIWSDRRAVAPWNWRKLSKIERDQYR